MSRTITVKCLDCRYPDEFNPESPCCPQCGSLWREACYDYPNLGKALPKLLAGRPFDLWRYKELLPLREVHRSLSMGEGGTPLIHAANLGMMLGCPNIYIKDERQGPTNSFKDRQAAVGIAALKEAGITEVVLASTGNVAIAYSAYAARAGIKLWAFLTSLVPAEKMREVAIYGTEVVKVTSSYDEAKKLAAEFARQRNLYLESGARTIPSVESMKTISFEIAEQVTDLLGPENSTTSGYSHPWRVPDWYIQSVSGGLGPLGVQKGFDELVKMGLAPRKPGMVIVQVEGCSPMVAAWKKEERVAQPVRVPRTHISTLATGDPGRTYTLLYERSMETGRGLFESVSDEETFRTIHILAKMEGLSVEPAAAVGFAGLIRLIREGKIKQNDYIVVNCTGHTMPVEKELLGDNWARSLSIPPHLLADTPQEGLLAALNKVTPDRFPRILIVDDVPDARRLIRRILQSQGNYTIFEAANGFDAMDLTQQEYPDLIILDLMMPEIDGFAVLDALKANPETAPIPVIVVTAKELTSEERERLRGHIHSLMQKGEFMSDEFMDEITSLIG